MKELKSNTKQDIATKIKTIREENNLTITEFAQKIQFSEKWLKKAETARGNLNWYLLLKIAAAFNKNITINFKDKA